MAKLAAGRYQRRDPVSGAKMEDGITAIVSDVLNVTYQARWSWVGADGRRHQGTATRKTLAEAEELLLDRRLKVKRGIYRPDEAITMAEYFEQWFPRKRSSAWRSSSAFRVRHDWEQHFKDTVGPIPVAKMTRAICQREIDRLVALRDPDDATKPRYAPASIRLFATVLTGVLEGAFRDEIIDRNPAMRLGLPKQRKTTKKVWTAAQAKQFLEATKGSYYHDMWWFLLTTGCRFGEAAGLRWSAVDLDNARVTFRATRRRKEDGTYQLGDGTKTSDEDQTIPLVPVMVDRLRDHQRAQRQQRVVALDGLVFPSVKGKLMQSGPFRRNLYRQIEAAGLPRITPHGMRHTTATLLLSLRVPESLVKEILRHASIATTINTYLHPDEELLREAVARLGDAYHATTSPSDEGDVVENV